MINAKSAALYLRNRTHFIFGSNTDVGKSVFSAGIVNASIRRQHEVIENEQKTFRPNNTKPRTVQYIKPLQCGGSDQTFVDRYLSMVQCSKEEEGEKAVDFTSCILHRWETPASPHLACRLENHYLSDEDVVRSLMNVLDENDEHMTSFIETAGGALSPGPCSKKSVADDRIESRKLWTTQGDIYSILPVKVPAVLVGDPKLGGISATLSTLESLWIRGFDVEAIILLDINCADQDGESYTSAKTNCDAIKEYISSHKDYLGGKLEEKRLLLDPELDIIHISEPLPPMPETLDNWFSNPKTIHFFDGIEGRLEQKWLSRNNSK